jgi:two-component system phosphate regulon response regulator PhoB
MLTARSEEIDRVVGFEVGADDYVTKPFSVRELMLRVKAILRRRPEAAEEESSPAIERAGLKIDVGAHRVWVDGQEIALTATEFKLLLNLARQAGRVRSRGQLLQEVWEMPPHLNTRTVDTHVKRLREKLGSAAALIETVRGVGYRFAE